MYDNLTALLYNIQKLEPRADQTQMQTAALSLSRCSGSTPSSILENLYQDLLCGIPLRQTVVGKTIYLGVAC